MENSQKLNRALSNYISVSSMIRRDEEVSFTFDIDMMKLDKNRQEALDSNYHRILKKVYETGQVSLDIYHRLSVSNQASSLSWASDYNKRTIGHLNDIEEKLNTNLILQKSIQASLKSDSEDILFEIESQIKKLKESNIVSNLKTKIEAYVEKLEEVKKVFWKNDTYLSNLQSDLNNPNKDKSHLEGMDFRNNDLYKNPLFSDALKGFKVLNEMDFFNKNEKIDFSEFKAYINEIDKLYKDFFVECLNAKYEALEADKFMQFVKKNPMSLNAQIESFDTLFKEETQSFSARMPIKNIELADSSYSNVLVFSDSSIIIVDSKGKFNNILKRDEIDSMVNDVLKEDINKTLKKNPFYTKAILSIIEEDREAVKGFKSNYLNSFIESFKEHLDILKLYKFDIKETFMEATSQNIKDYKRFEYLDDTVNKIVKKHKVKQYAESISSNKYSHLYNDQTYVLCEGLYDLDITKSQFQEYMGKKIAAYQTPEQFNNGLKTLLDSFNSFTPEATVQKADHVGAEVYYEEENLVILKVTTFEQSKVLGSSSWCISRDANYFDSYATDNEQYFIYDFSKESTNIASTIGLTVSPEGEYVASHYKNDDEAEPRDVADYIDLVNEVYKTRSLENKNQNKLKV